MAKVTDSLAGIPILPVGDKQDLELTVSRLREKLQTEAQLLILHQTLLAEAAALFTTAIGKHSLTSEDHNAMRAWLRKDVKAWIKLATHKK